MIIGHEVVMEQKGNYQIKEIKNLGGGGFGQVDLIELYTMSGNLCKGKGDSSGCYARKILSVRKEFVGTFYSAEDWKRRFQREVRYQTNCKHKNIVQIFIHNLESDRPWFIMELAEDNLRKELKDGVLVADGSRIPLSSAQKINIVKMMLEGVKHIHSKGYVHRDLKPENILRYSGGIYKISDFGLIKNTNKTEESEMISNMQVALGTADYMSPESKKGFSNEKSDIYSLGVIIDEMNITGAKGIDDIIRISTHYKPAHRYNSISDMLAALETIQMRSES